MTTDENGGAAAAKAPVSLRLSAEEIEAVDRVARVRGWSRARVIRELGVRQAEAESRRIMRENESSVEGVPSAGPTY